MERSTSTGLQKTRNDIVLSIVSPLYNEEETIPELYRRLTESCIKITADYEIILVDDGSKDRTFEQVRLLAGNDAHIKYIRFSRNFGHQHALSAGLAHAKGEAVVLIDGDLQDPPELIPDLFRVYKEGYEVVYARRQVREGESWFKRYTAKQFYKILNSLTTTRIPMDTGDFRLISNKVVAALNAMPENHKFLRGQVAWVGFRQKAYLYDRDERKYGKTKYSLKKMLTLAVDGLTSFSSFPLRLATWLGFTTSALSIVAIIYVLVSKYVLLRAISGWTSIMVSVLFIGGIQLICLGIIGEYIGRIYAEVRGRPYYIIDESNIPGTKSGDL